MVTRSAVWADLRLVPTGPPGRVVPGELGGAIDWHTLEGEGTEVTIDVPLLYLTRR